MKYNIKTLADDLGNNIKIAYDKNNLEKEKYLKNNVMRKINLTMSTVCENEVALLVSKLIKGKYSILVDVYLPYKNENNKKKLYRPDIAIIKTYKKNDKIINEIVGLIEVKSQMGYSGILSPDDFTEKLKKLKPSKIKITLDEYERLSKDAKNFYMNLGIVEAKDSQYIEYIIGSKLNIFIVNVMGTNHVKNVEGTIYKFLKNDSRIHFYNLYGQNKNETDLWYHNLSYKNIYENNDEIKKVNITRKDNKKTEHIKYMLDKKIRENHGFEKFVEDIIKTLEK